MSGKGNMINFTADTDADETKCSHRRYVKCLTKTAVLKKIITLLFIDIMVCLTSAQSILICIQEHNTIKQYTLLKTSKDTQTRKHRCLGKD